MKEEFHFLSSNKKSQVYALRWIPDHQEIRCIVQITHGMKEFLMRYEPFALFLNSQGIAVVGMDLLGHGNSASEGYGFFHETNGNECLVHDIHQLYIQTKTLFPNVPYVLLGHSMGSFLTRQYLTLYGHELSGAVIMGTGHPSKGLLKIGRGLLNILVAFKGPKAYMPFLDRCLNKAFCHKISPVKSPADWICGDEDVVKAYLLDERCTFDFSLSSYRDLVQSIIAMQDKEKILQMPKDLPLLFVSGEQDAVGNYGKGVQKAYDFYQKLGMENLKIILYPKARHEILNEKNCQVVYQDILQWLLKEII